MPSLEARPRSRPEVALGEDARGSQGRSPLLRPHVLDGGQDSEEPAFTAAGSQASGHTRAFSRGSASMGMMEVHTRWSSEEPGVNSEYLQSALERKPWQPAAPGPAHGRVGRGLQIISP